MSHHNLNHRRTHNLLLISKLLNQRDHTSPFTLVLDNLEEPAKPLLREYLRRAKIARTHVIFVSFETFKKPADVGHFVLAHKKTPLQLSQSIAEAVESASKTTKNCLIIFDTLNTLANASIRQTSNLNLTGYLSSFLQPPQGNQTAQISMLGVLHNDTISDVHATPYFPPPFALLSYLATTIITVHSLSLLVAQKAARERSMEAPVFGLAEGSEGVLIGLKPTNKSLRDSSQGIVLELEHRRRSGRGVLEWYFLPDSKQQPIQSASTFKENAMLLDDHPMFRQQKEEAVDDQELAGLTFELGLTNRQRQEREGVVLPYFDAQKAGGGGEGGRILYDMGVEDDFDEEEDEI